MNIREESGFTTSNGFQIAWDYDNSLSRVTEWIVRYSQQVGEWNEKVIANPAARNIKITLSESELGTLYAVEVISISDGVTSKDIGRVQVTIRKFYTLKCFLTHMIFLEKQDRPNGTQAVLSKIHFSNKPSTKLESSCCRSP